MANEYEFMDLRHIEIGNGCSTNGLVGGAPPTASWKNTYEYDLDHRVKDQYNRTGLIARAPTPANAGTENIYTTSYGYDALRQRGLGAPGVSITTLTRDGLWDNPTGLFEDLVADEHYGQIDQLAYSYIGSRLASVTDDADTPGSELGLPTNTGTMAYDGLGNLLSMPGRGVSFDGYNALNLPGTMTTAAGEIAHTYDGSGATLRQACIMCTEREEHEPG